MTHIGSISGMATAQPVLGRKRFAFPVVSRSGAVRTTYSFVALAVGAATHISISARSLAALAAGKLLLGFLSSGWGSVSRVLFVVSQFGNHFAVHDIRNIGIPRRLGLAAHFGIINFVLPNHWRGCDHAPGDDILVSLVLNLRYYAADGGEST